MEIIAPRPSFSLSQLSETPAFIVYALQRAAAASKMGLPRCQQWNGYTLSAQLTDIPQLPGHEGHEELFAIGAHVVRGVPEYVLAVAQIGVKPSDGRYYIAAKADTPEGLILRIIAYAETNRQLLSS